MTIPSQPTTNMSLGPTLAPTLRSISSEFGDPHPGAHSMSEFYRNGPRVPANPLNAGLPTSGEITMAQFNGTTSTPAATLLSYTISSPIQNLNLFTYANSQAPVPTRYPAFGTGFVVTFIISPDVIVGSASIPQVAMQSGTDGPTTWHPSVPVVVVNQGAIVGAGGSGGNASGDPGSTSGESGGTAVVAQRPITIQNSPSPAARISGGGGGGGGAGVKKHEEARPDQPAPPNPQYGPTPIPPIFYYLPGGSGGGGSGITGGPAGSAPLYPGTGATVLPVPGGVSGAGTGGEPGGDVNRWAGGGGGGLGAGGTPGQGVSPDENTTPETWAPTSPGPSVAGVGGSAGFYTTTNPLITWQEIGNREGQVS